MPRAAVALLAAAGLGAGAWLPAAAEELVDIRLYPAPEYTRLVIESKAPLDYRLGLAQNPPRLYLHFRTADGDRLLEALDAIDLSHAPYIESVRAARNDGEHLRIVFELREAIEKSLFSLAPYDIYQARTVLDITPAKDIGGKSAATSRCSAASASTSR
ncbi:MAG: AMIN domain-containing protein [Betaproteobacteria bacterium AqS2]|uniref:AMIN domain-containing protein n=1 Tax=Candidatus Amphirhobacter heronislandensis TaxID=1732024 RepID=A0A930UDJ5_9GAMM|nr:AMIN domain-containing protein [Betaproteobacteria bacterium AqS2]